MPGDKKGGGTSSINIFGSWSARIPVRSSSRTAFDQRAISSRSSTSSFVAWLGCVVPAIAHCLSSRPAHASRLCALLVRVQSYVTCSMCPQNRPRLRIVSFLRQLSRTGVCAQNPVIGEMAIFHQLPHSFPACRYTGDRGATIRGESAAILYGIIQSPLTGRRGARYFGGTADEVSRKATGKNVRRRSPPFPAQKFPFVTSGYHKAHLRIDL